MKKVNILIIDESGKTVNELLDFLFKHGYEVKEVDTLSEGIKLLEKFNYDIVFLGITEIKNDIKKSIDEIKNVKKSFDLVLGISPELLETVKDLSKNKVSEFVLNPYKNEEVLFVIERILKKRGIEHKLSFLLSENIELIELVSLYRRLLRLVVNIDLDRLKDQFLDEILECTYGKIAVLYIFSEGDYLIYDRHRGGAVEFNFSNKLLKNEIEKGDKHFFCSKEELNLPLYFEDRIYALVKVRESQLKDGFTEKDFNRALHFCEFIPYAFENAMKFEMLKKCSIKNYETNVYYWDIFKDFANKEIYKAIRYDRKLSLLGIKIENLAELKKHHSEGLIKRVLVDIIDSINNVIRESDWFVERKEGDYLLILTETDYFGSLMAIPRIKKSLVGKCILKGAQRVDELNINISAVGLPLHGITLDSLLDNLNSRLNISKNSLIYKLNLHKHNFEEICEKIFNMSGSSDEYNKRVYSWRKDRSEVFFETLLLILDEIKLHPGRRGVLYAGFFDGKEVSKIFEKRDYQNLATKIYFFCSSNKEDVDLHGVITVGSDKALMTNFYFLLSLNEHHTYMLLNINDEFFETNDFLLVEELISKLQTEYYLQWQL
jgi:GGDEF domain-containing protein